MSNNKQSMKLYTEEDLIDLVQSLKDYTHESHSILGHDERDAKEFVDIFLKDRTPIELPSDEEIEEKLNVAYGNGYEQGEMDFYKKMQVKGDKYAEGYSGGYKRALELVKWRIDNELQGGNNEQQ